MFGIANIRFLASKNCIGLCLLGLSMAASTTAAQ